MMESKIALQQYKERLLKEQEQEGRMKHHAAVSSVHYGTPLFSGEEENVEALKENKIQKYTSEWNQYATDEKGKRRFHGAFKGGFSAGYFNTVGTKEGFVPKSFVSSKDQKASFQQSVADFMDEEDIEEAVINPVQTTQAFHSSAGKTMSAIDDAHLNILFGAPGSEEKKVLDTMPTYLPMELISTRVSISQIGISLLRKMGWQEGRAIGERRIRKKAEKKIYGVSMPPHLHKEYEEERVEEIVAYDVASVLFQPKDNLYGIGYRHNPLDPLLARSRRADSNHIKMSDYDRTDGIYSTLDMDEYDFSFIRERTAPLKMQSINIVFEEAKEVYHQQQRIYPPPEVPKGYIPTKRNSFQEQIRREEELEKEQKIELERRSKPLFESEHTKELRERLSSAIATRFTKGEQQDMTLELKEGTKYGLIFNTADNYSKTETNTLATPKQPQMPLVRPPREMYDWYPEALLCKRLSVRNPYPHTTHKGTQGRSIKKGSSIFDNSLFKGGDTVPSAAISVPAETTKSNVDDVFTNEEKIVTTQRPAMDIFKAVFEDDEEENEQEIMPVPPPQLINEEDHAEITFSSIEPKNFEGNEDEDDVFPFSMIQKLKETEKRMKEVQNESLKPSYLLQGVLTPKEKPTGGSSTSNVSNSESKLAALQSQIQELKQILGDDISSSSSSSSSESNRKRKRKRKSKSKHKKEKHHHRSHRKHSSSDEHDNEEARHRKHKKAKHRRKD